MHTYVYGFLYFPRKSAVSSRFVRSARIFFSKYFGVFHRYRRRYVIMINFFFVCHVHAPFFFIDNIRWTDSPSCLGNRANRYSVRRTPRHVPLLHYGSSAAAARTANGGSAGPEPGRGDDRRPSHMTHVEDGKISPKKQKKKKPSALAFRSRNRRRAARFEWTKRARTDTRLTQDWPE